MDPKRFDALARWITAKVPRRAFGLFGATALSGAVASLARLDATAKRRKQNKKCKPCRSKKHGKCKVREADWTPCGAGKTCQNGSCVQIVCDPPCTLPETCVYGTCYCPDQYVCGDTCCPEPVTQEDDDCFCMGDPCACPETAILLAAGDIAACDSNGHIATAKLLDGLEGTVIPLGDTAYQSGSREEFTNCYDPTWGRHKARTRPALGDHEYDTPGAAGYFEYFGAKAGDPDKGYYSYDLGTWHIVVLNTNCDEIGGCDAGSPQERWLRADLAANPASCTLAVIHHPRFSSGTTYGNNRGMSAFWQALYDAGADVVLSGNEHNYERFAPQDPNGARDDRRGIRQFVVGTGGIGTYRIGSPIANSEVRNDETWGVLEMTLRPGAYDWRFVPVAGHSFTDSGSAVCNSL